MNLNTHTESKNLFLKTYILFWCILFSSFVNGQNKNIVETSMKELLTELDIRLDKTADYESQNIQKIKAAQKQLQEANNPKDKLLPARILVEEFLFYQSDSSLYYADLAVSIARQTGNHTAENQMLSRKAIIYALCGMPWERETILDSLCNTPMDKSAKNEVFKAYIDVLELYQSHNLPNNLISRNYIRMGEMEDSVNKYDPEPHSRLLRLKYRNNSEQEVIDWVKKMMQKTGNLTEKSAYAMILADKYHQQNKLDERNRYWTLAAIYDIEANKMFSTALIKVATLMAEQEQWERASKYASCALHRAIFYRARSNTYELAPILEQCMLHEKKQSNTRALLAITATVILLLTIGMSFLFIRKYRKTSEQNQQELKKSKEENELLNNQLQQSETSLKHLSKGVVNFLSISIDSIFELGSMRHTVLNKLRSKEIEQLTALFKGETNLAQNQKRLLRRFDIAFSRLYPDFQKQVNDLLKDDCKIESPENELLNNELRLLALMKIGITDSSRIATILDISVNTVYFYRNRLKNKARDKENFEEEVLKITF